MDNNLAPASSGGSSRTNYVQILGGVGDSASAGRKPPAPARIAAASGDGCYHVGMIRHSGGTIAA
jgi:hypothetical protein